MGARHLNIAAKDKQILLDALTEWLLGFDTGDPCIEGIDFPPRQYLAWYMTPSVTQTELI